jgi:dihydropteroate synthase-like protein
MMGVGNVVELMDIDSIGINGLLAAVAVELDVSLILTTENSQKTRNSVKELKRAIEMNFLAKTKGSLPKDLGFNLLLAKAKGKGVIFNLPSTRVIPVPETVPKFKKDSKGYFNIFVDFEKDQIVAAHFKDKYDYVFEGANAESVSKKIIEKGLVSNLEHAAYLGRELQKAEMYLKMKRGYIQDEDFSGF